jgi:hypothetical protein
MNLSKSQKSIIVLSSIWTVVSLLIAAGIAESSYGGFSVATFLIFLFVSASPVWLYWSGAWIWGFGYIYNAIRRCFFKRQGDSSEVACEPKSSFTVNSVMKKIVGVIAAIFAAGIIATIMLSLGDIMDGAFSGTDEAKRNLEAIGNIFSSVLTLKVGIEVYKMIVRNKKQENILLEKDYRPRWQAIVGLLICFGTLFWLNLEVYGWLSADGLESIIYEAIGGFSIAYFLIVLFNKRWKIKKKNTPYAAASIAMICVLSINLPKVPDSRDARELVIELNQASSPDDYIKKIKASKTKLGQSITVVLDELEENTKTLNNLDDERLSEALSPDTLKNQKKLLLLLEIAKQKKILAEQAPDKIENTYQSVFSKKDELSRKSPEAMQEFWSVILKSYNEQKPATADFIKAYVDFYDNIVGLYEILLEQSGLYSVSNQGVYFKNNDVVDSYNRYLTGIADASNRIKKIHQVSAESTQQNLSKTKQ